MQPDPIEWAYFLLCLVATGRRRQALAYLMRYPEMRHAELARVTRALHALRSGPTGVERPSPSNRMPGPHRASIHTLRIQSDEEWADSVVAMLRACNRGSEADLIALAFAEPCSRLDPQNLDRGFDMEPAARVPVRSGAASRRPIRLEPLDWRTPLRVAKRVLLRSARPVRNALRPIVRAAWSPTTSDPRLPGLAELLQREAVTSAVCVGASRKSPLTQVFIDGLSTNANATTLVLAHSATQGREHHVRYPGKRFAQVDVEAVLPHIPIPSLSSDESTAQHRLSSFALVAIDFDEVPQFELNPAQTPAAVFVLYGVNTRNGHRAQAALREGHAYDLVDFDALLGSGYAVFRRAPSQAGVARGQPRYVRPEVAA
jgi:hypothetical protein